MCRAVSGPFPPGKECGSVMEKSLLRRIWNRVLGRLARELPGCTTTRPFLHRLRGVHIEGKVFIGDDVYLENEYPEFITLREGAQINLRTTIIAHTRDNSRVVVGKDVLVAACCVLIAPPGGSLTIGDGSVVGAGSVITSDVPPMTLVAPERPKPYAMVTVPFTMNTDHLQFRKGLRPLKTRQPASAPTNSAAASDAAGQRT